MVEIMLIYYSAANKGLTEEDIIKKIRELEGKGEKIMTVLQEREQRGIEQGILLGELKRERELVRDLIREGVSTDIITRTSKLSTNEIEAIKKELSN